MNLQNQISGGDVLTVRAASPRVSGRGAFFTIKAGIPSVASNAQLVVSAISCDRDAAEEAVVSRVTGIQAYQYFRDVCSWRLMTVD